LWPQSAVTPGASLYMPMKCSSHFWNYRQRFIVDLNSDEVLGNHRRQSEQSRNRRTIVTLVGSWILLNSRMRFARADFVNVLRHQPCGFIEKDFVKRASNGDT
jgi:hypothetical protein